MAHHAPRVFNEINITPLTDIFLVLLIIMMVVAPMLDYPGIKLAVPSVGPDETTTQEPKTMTVRIAASGDAELIQDGQGQALTPILLPNRLRDLKATAPDGLVEAFSVTDAPSFSFAVQWHPEWRHQENPLSQAIFQAFGRACRKHHATRHGLENEL